MSYNVIRRMLYKERWRMSSPLRFLVEKAKRFEYAKRSLDH